MTSTAKTKKKSKVAEPSRKLTSPSHKSFRLSKVIVSPKKNLPKARNLFVQSTRHILKNKRIFFGITGIYLLLTILLVKGLSGSNEIPELKQTLQEALGGTTGQLAASTAIFGLLLGNTTVVNSEVAGTYQSILLIVTSLAIIWALRQTHANKSIWIREAYYRGMYPLIPFLAVLFVIGLQLLPLAAASWLFNITVVAGLAVTTIEQVVWIILCFLLALLSLYMVSSSVFALYVVTLPDMTPMRALRSTRELVRQRRWEILRKVLFLPLMLLIIGAVIMLPLILYLTPLAEWAFFVLSMFALGLSHSYMYSLYRELL